MEIFTDNRNDVKVSWPAHSVLIGKSMSGKSHLAATIIDRIDDIFNRKMETYIVVILSPHAEIENVLLNGIDEKWTVLYFSIPIFTEQTLDGILQYLSKIELLGHEIFMLFDDILIKSVGDNSTSMFLVRAFAMIRHHNISLIATVQSDSAFLMDILKNCSFIFVMQTFGCFQTLSKIIRNFVGLINVPALIRKIYPLLEKRAKGSYILVNISFEADRNQLFTISNGILAQTGFTKQYLNTLSIENDKNPS